VKEQGSISYQKYLSGDDQGMVELIRDYRDGLMLYLNSFTGNIQEAEELAMDTFVKLGVQKPKDRGKAGFKTWLYAIGRNIAIDHLRRRSRSKEVPLEDYPNLSDDEAYLERSYIRQENKIAIHRAMGKLPSQYRQVLWLVYFEDFTMKQAAGVLKKSVHNVEVLTHRARKALRKALEMEGFVYENL